MRAAAGPGAEPGSPAVEDTEQWRLARAHPGRDMHDAQLALEIRNMDFATADRIMRLPLFDVACGRTHIKLSEGR